MASQSERPGATTAKRTRTLPPRSADQVMPTDLPAPTSVSLPARDGLRTIELPLNDAYEGLETLANEDSASLILDDESDSTSELSVVFRSAHHSERPAHSEHTPSLRWSGRRGSARPPSGSPESNQADHVEIPEPPRLPGDVITPPPPAPVAANFEDELDDFDDDVDTTVMDSKLPAYQQSMGAPVANQSVMSKSPTMPPKAALPRMAPPPVPSVSVPYAGGYQGALGQDSLRPVEVRPATQPPPSRALPRGPRRSGWLALAAGCVFGGSVIAAAGVWIEGESGELVIDVADQQCGAVDAVQVFVDDQLACTASPCNLRVSAGTHVVHAEAEGYEITEAQAVVVDPDVPTLHRIQFGASTRTGIEVRSQQAGYSLYLDGKLVGELPQRITGLSTGEHTLLVSGGEGYYAEEKKVVLDADEMLVLENIELKPRTGQLKIAGDSQLDGATVTLDGKPIELPYEAQVDASKRHHLVAKRRGYEDFEAYVEFSASERERELNIQLMPKSAGGSESPSAEASQASEPRRSSASRSSRRATAAKAESEPSKATGKATLSLTSDPPANVLLDGTPIGRTPKMGLSVAAGTHTVLFVHPTLGRARASAKLEAGQSKTLRARF